MDLDLFVFVAKPAGFEEGIFVADRRIVCACSFENSRDITTCLVIIGNIHIRVRPGN